MARTVKKNRLTALALSGVLALSLGGCGVRTTPAETRIFAMDTVMSLTVYGKEGQEAMDRAVDTIYKLDRALSATDSTSAIFELNNGAGEWVDMDPDAASLLEDTLKLGEITGGALDVTAYSAVKSWGFTTGSYRVPDDQELRTLADHIDYSAVEVENGRARLPKGMSLDLGAVAKGHTGDLLDQQLREEGISSALLDLGQSSIQAIGSKPDGSPWRIGLQDPTGQGYLAVVELEDMAMGTSGGYQRFFEQDGQTYWHILDPDTAAPARTGLGSVTVVAPSGLICDGLSTALFVMGEEKGAQFWRDHPELQFDVIFIREDGSAAITAGLEDTFSLATGYEDREVTLIT